MYYTLILWGELNGIFGNTKFQSLRIILDSGSSYSSVLGKHAQTLYQKCPHQSDGAPKEVTSE